MGRFLRSALVVVGVMALFMAHSFVLGGLWAEPGARAVFVGVFFAMELMCVGFVALLQQPFFPPVATDASPAASWPGRLWRGGCLIAGLALLWLGFYATREGAADGLWRIVFGGLLLFEAQRRPRARRPPRPAMRAMAILFGLLQIYPGIVCAEIGFADTGAPDRLLMLILGAAILLASFGFIGLSLRGLLRSLPAPESLIEA